MTTIHDNFPVTSYDGFSASIYSYVVSLWERKDVRLDWKSFVVIRPFALNSKVKVYAFS